MYRNLEEHRDPKIAGDMKAAEAECPCACKEPAEQEKEAKPAGNRSGTQMDLYWDING